MSDPAFDTLGAARKLKTAGIEAEQADAIVEVMRESAMQLVTVEHFDAGLAKLQAQIGGQSNRIDSVQVQLQTQIDGLSGRIDSLQTLQAEDRRARRAGLIRLIRSELQAQIDGLSGRIDTLRIEMRADIVRSHLILVTILIAANALMMRGHGYLAEPGRHIVTLPG